MTQPLPSVKPEFFGKDKTVFFIGQVEDVNDPKKSGRVKVRCMGWHPKDKQGEQSVKTDELPWAHVGMPTTHAQQGRIGGKHYLLPGSWVVGLFLDGEEAQKPLILNSFNFTAGTSPENNRADSQSTDGTDSQGDRAFTKREPAPDLIPNSGTSTTNEGSSVGGDPLDPSKDTVTNDAQGGCGELKSQASKQRMEDDYKKGKEGNPESQNYEVIIGDGLCGSLKNAKDDVKRTLKETMPSSSSRYVYGDVVWSAFSGNYIDINAITRYAALLICNLLKQAAQAEKAKKEEEENRKAKSTAIKSQPGRNPKKRQEADKTTTEQSDLMHGIFGTSFIDTLCQLMLGLLQQVNNGDEGGDGARPNTPVEDWGADCIADTILNSVGSATTNALNSAQSESQSGSSSAGAIAGIIGALVGGLGWALEQKYSTKTDTHNSAGDMSQDQLTKQLGCLNFRMYNTNIGGTGGGNTVSNYPNLGFGGITGQPDGSTTPVICEDAVDPDNKPDGDGAVVIPHTTPKCYQNMINGIAGQVIVIESGERYYFENLQDAKKAFPRIQINGYQGIPVPVVDPDSGELVAVLTQCSSWSGTGVNPPVTVLPGDSEIGISTNDPNYDIQLDSIFIQNMGFNYCDVTIQVWDRDKDEENGVVTATVVDGHVVDVAVINKGTGFRRLPELRVKDECKGRGVVLYPVMAVVPSTELADPVTIDVIDCPPKNTPTLA